MYENIPEKIFNEGAFQKGPVMDGCSIYFKILPPVLYCINIVSYQSDEDDVRIENILKNIEKSLDNYMCNNIVFLSIVNGKGTTYNKIENIGDKIHSVLWIYDEKIIFPKGEPTKLNGFEKLFDEDTNKEEKIIETDKKPFLTYLFITINLAIWLYIFISKNESMVYALANSRTGFENGEFYRVITSMFVHMDIAHVFMNCFSLYIFGSITEKITGSRNFAIIYFLSGIIASFGSMIFNDTFSIGASGAVFGIIGALCFISKNKMFKVHMMDYFSVLVYIIVSIAIGYTKSNIDNAAHIFGAISGYIIQFLYERYNKLKTRHYK